MNPSGALSSGLLTLPTQHIGIVITLGISAFDERLEERENFYYKTFVVNTYVTSNIGLIT